MNNLRQENTHKGRIIFRALLLLAGVFLYTQAGSAQQNTAAVLAGTFKNQRSVVSVNFNKEPLLNALHELARKAKVGISYKTDILPSKRITYKEKNVDVYTVLDVLLERTGLSYTLLDNRKVILIKQKSSDLHVQQSTVSGTVTDAQTGDTLAGVNILIVGTSTGTATDVNGHYSLRVENLQDTLRFSFIGYETQTVPINGRTSLNVALKTATTGLEQMVITGFGKVSKQQFTGSSSQISEEDIENQPITTPSEALKGKATGLRLTPSTGTPGATQQINIRGISSINASTNPLYVLDGIPIKSGELSTGNNNSHLGLLSTLDPSDIKSMTVLKGATATALYGARGSNGVIVITTKEGSTERKTIYSVSYQRGGSKVAVAGPELANSQQWSELYKEAQINSGTDPSQVQTPWDGVTNTDWKNVIEQDHAISQNFSLSASGGSDRTTFFASTNYKHQDGINMGSDFKRIQGRLNFGYDASDAVNFRNKLVASYVKQNSPVQEAGSFSSPELAKYLLVPSARPYNKDGSINVNNWNQAIYNPVWLAKHDINRKQIYRALDNLSLNIDLLKNLSFESQLGLDYIVAEEKYYNNPILGNGKAVNGQVAPDYSRNFNFTWKNSFAYKWQINQANEINIKALQEAQKNKYYTVQARATNFATTGLSNAASAGTPTRAYSFANDWSSLAFMGNARYSFKNKYNLQATYRYEGNSRFAKKNRWGDFYSIGASWLLTEEPFLKKAEGWLDNLKLRSNYGKTGNAGIGINEYQTFLSFDGSYNGQGAISTGQLGNQYLTWEKATTIDVGLNLGLINRITIDATYFRKKSKDLLLNVPVSSTVGQDHQRKNLGELLNQGVELSLDIDVIKSNSFNWSLGAKYTKVKNEVISLPKNSNGNPTNLITDYKYTGAEGYPAGGWYMRSWAGVNPENGKPLWYMNITDSEGNITGRTTTSSYNEATRYYQGASAMPTDFGNINTNLRFMGFYLNASLTYTFGNKIYDYWYRYIVSDGVHIHRFNETVGSYKNRWRNPGDKAKNPQIILGGNNLSTEPSSRYLYNGSYLRLQNLSIGYNISSSLISRLDVGITSATIYFDGQNLWTYTFDDNLKWDPEVRQDGMIYWNAQALRTIILGIKFKF